MIKKEKILMLLIIYGIFLCPVYAEEINVEMNDIDLYTGKIAYEHSFYQLKLFFENIDEMLTFDPMRKMEKKMDHARLRIAEAKFELLMNRTENADKVMLHYGKEVLEVEDLFVDILEDEDIKGISSNQIQDIQKEIERQKIVLENLDYEGFNHQFSLEKIEQIQTRLQEFTGNTIKGEVFERNFRSSW